MTSHWHKAGGALSRQQGAVAHVPSSQDSSASLFQAHSKPGFSSHSINTHSHSTSLKHFPICTKTTSVVS